MSINFYTTSNGKTTIMVVQFPDVQIIIRGGYCRDEQRRRHSEPYVSLET